MALIIRAGVPLLLLALSGGSHAFPTGAGGCDSGNALGPPHFDATALVSDGTLQDKGVEVTVNGIDLLGVPAFPVGEDLPWVVLATAAPMKGILLRAAALDGSDAAVGSLTTTNFLYQPASGVCLAPTDGITHKTSADKTIAQGTIRFDVPADVQLDVTVVFANNATVSDFAHTSYTITFDDAPAAPTASVGINATDVPNSPPPAVSPAPTLSLAGTTSSPTSTEPCYLCGSGRVDSGIWYSDDW